MKRVPLAVFTVVLLASSFYLNSNIPETHAAVSLLNYKLYSNGEGGTSSIHWDGTKFILTQNIEGTITLMDNNTMLDGAGFTVKGNGDSIGIAVYDKHDITIQNVNMENFKTCILLGHYVPPDSFLFYDSNPARCTNCTVSNCQVSNSNNGITIIGIKCLIENNQVTNNTNGITSCGSENVFKNNHMTNNKISFDDLASQKSDVDISNIIDGKPIYFIVNQQNITVPDDAGMVHLENCQNITIDYLHLSHSSNAIALFNSSNCNIAQNTVTNCTFGISLRDSANNSITGNELRNNYDDAINQFDTENTIIANNLIEGNGGGIDCNGYDTVGSRNAVISSNRITANGGCGIQVGTKCTVTGNYIASNGQYGIYGFDISHSIIERNWVTNNKDSGLCFRIGKDVSIIGNNFTNNSAGIEMGDLDNAPSGCVVKENDFVNNTNLAIQIYGDAKGNIFFLNNLIDNNNGRVQASIKGRFVWHGDLGYDENLKVFPQYYASYNAWDNGSMGNYWSDFNQTVGVYYQINETNIDWHPQMLPFQFKQLEMPQAGLETQGPISDSGSGKNDVSAMIAIPTGIIVSVIVATFIFILRRNKK